MLRLLARFLTITIATKHLITTKPFAFFSGGNSRVHSVARIHRPSGKFPIISLSRIANSTELKTKFIPICVIFTILCMVFKEKCIILHHKQKYTNMHNEIQINKFFRLKVKEALKSTSFEFHRPK